MKSRPWPSQSASLSESPRKSSSDPELFSLSESSCRYCDHEIMLGSFCGGICAMVVDYGPGGLVLSSLTKNSTVEIGARGRSPRPMGSEIGLRRCVTAGRKIKKSSNHTDPLTTIDPESSWPSRHLTVAGEVLCGQFYTLTHFPCLFVRHRPLKGSLGFRIVFAICPTSSLTAWITHLVPRSRLF